MKLQLKFVEVLKKTISTLILLVIIMGCATENHVSQQPPPSLKGTATPSALKRVTPVTPTRMMVTPNPDGQILDDTRWVLDHAILNEELRDLKDYEYFRIDFKHDSVGIYDGCNQGSYKNSSGLPSYIATDNGEFVLPFKELGEDSRYTTSFGSTMKMCFHVDEESGERHPIGPPDFVPPFTDIIGYYELSADQLHLYYPEDRENVLVFEQVPNQPHPTEVPTQTPEPTMTLTITVTASPTINPYPVSTVVQTTSQSKYP